MIHKILSSIFIYSLILYFIAKYCPQLWFSILPSESINIEIILLLWAIFWAINDIIKSILKLITLPFRILSLWLLWIGINIAVFYWYQYIISSLDIWIQIQLWTIVQIIILSIIIGIVNLLFKNL